MCYESQRDFHFGCLRFFAFYPVVQEILLSDFVIVLSDSVLDEKVSLQFFFESDGNGEQVNWSHVINS